jgi:hypothetical protein
VSNRRNGTADTRRPQVVKAVAEGDGDLPTEYWLMLTIKPGKKM